MTCLPRAQKKAGGGTCLQATSGWQARAHHQYWAGLQERTLVRDKTLYGDPAQTRSPI